MEVNSPEKSQFYAHNNASVSKYVLECFLAISMLKNDTYSSNEYDENPVQYLNDSSIQDIVRNA